MGTRADFYVGRGKDAEWLGSIAMDGYPDAPGHPKVLLDAKNEAEFRERVEGMLSLGHATRPEQGWPWPWNDSGTTDYAYAFDEDCVWVSDFGHSWVDARSLCIDEEPVVFPDMEGKKNLTMGARSGLLVIGDPS